MKTIILYDSVFGNTEKIAKAISKSFNSDVTLTTVQNTSIEKILAADLLIVGSPVHGGRPTPALEHFLHSLPARSLEKINVTAFDTRFASEDHGIGLKILMKIIQYAANRIARILEEKGGRIIAPPTGFIVQDKKGPLKTGELNRAQDWASLILKNFNQSSTVTNEYS